MKKSHLNIMNRSFTVLDERRARLLKDPETLKLKKRVQDIREYAVDHLEELLEEAASNLEENGVEVIMAPAGLQAREAIQDQLEGEVVVAKSKSNTAGEILLTEYLEEEGVEVLETDLGDRIVQMHQESRPSHPIGPAAHLDLEMIAEIVSSYLGKEVESQPRSILEAVKEDILTRLPDIRVGITGANSVAAQDGALLMVHNEGNISMLSLLDVHIILVGIDKVVATLEDAVSVVKLETIYATGKKTPAYMNVVSSPSKTADIEQELLKDMYGARRVVVVFLDNGRRKVLEEGGESLTCIGCGSCIVNCPVYRVSGPDFGYRRHLGGRGVVLSRYLEDDQTCTDSGLFKCTLCGNCTRECPLEIPTNQILELLRRECVEGGLQKEEHQVIRDNIKKRGSAYRD
ncbi:lactate utilization protein [Methanobacterium sp. CWC-01]|uniref:LUD domain-containing protein n=1 Tax=Methanobacterium aridiramus TaxID=2584467 RepID=UPI0025753BA9|nr:LUD domain-containing protein [Methanobacterium sp. CWC-01]WJI10300.1 lactate utilization protein [Methanobacterium sp. CWC-01]